MNGTPIEWYSKRQGTVETATYGSEFVAARTATDQVIDIRLSLRYLGVPVKEKTYMFGDNQSVITSSTIPQSALNKRHNALSYHRVREAIAAGIMRFVHIMGSTNTADVLSKHCGYPQLMPLVRPILFWQGDPTFCNDGTSDELEPEGSCTENISTSVDPSTKATCTH
jgi:protein involved in ribonucleotide reduction